MRRSLVLGCPTPLKRHNVGENNPLIITHLNPPRSNLRGGFTRRHFCEAKIMAGLLSVRRHNSRLALIGTRIPASG